MRAQQTIQIRTATTVSGGAAYTIQSVSDEPNKSKNYVATSEEEVRNALKAIADDMFTPAANSAASAAASGGTVVPAGRGLAATPTT